MDNVCYTMKTYSFRLFGWITLFAWTCEDNVYVAESVHEGITFRWDHERD